MPFDTTAAGPFAFAASPSPIIPFRNTPLTESISPSSSTLLLLADIFFTAICIYPFSVSLRITDTGILYQPEHSGFFIEMKLPGAEAFIANPVPVSSTRV